MLTVDNDAIRTDFSPATAQHFNIFTPMPYLSSYTSVHVIHILQFVCLCVCPSVLDVNDETPTFNPHVYNVSLKESVPRDHIVARLACSDNDAGLNAELSYFITGQRSRLGLVLSV